MRNHGFTLLELTMAMAILTVVGGMLLLLSISLGSATQAQEAKITTGDEARSAMLQIVRQVRQASRASIPPGSLPGPVLTYRIAQDISGNGSAVNQTVALETSAVRTIQRDTDDLNNDGIRDTQLIMTEGGAVTVLANNIMLDGANNNPNGFDRGVWFEQVGQAIRITIQTQRPADASGRVVESTMVETVLPRN
jgi:prepilin-type N-terminal cleavage/methylation domain-containing protein